MNKNLYIQSLGLKSKLIHFSQTIYTFIHLLYPIQGLFNEKNS